MLAERPFIRLICHFCGLLRTRAYPKSYVTKHVTNTSGSHARGVLCWYGLIHPRASAWQQTRWRGIPGGERGIAVAS
jgi:hypothetical protein